MKTIESVIGRDLQWVQPRFFKHYYELRNLSTLVAKLEIPKVFSAAARAESADGCWVLNQKGIWKGTITVSACGDETPVATFPETRLSTKQPLPLAGGETLMLRSDFFGWTHTLQTETGELLLQVKRRGLFKSGYAVDLRRRGASYAELPWLVFLVFYFMILRERRARAH